MPIIRSAPRHVSIPLAALTDTRLSWRATGLLVHLLNLDGGTEIGIDSLYARKEKKQAVRTAMKELEAAGWVRQAKVQDAQGRFSTRLEVGEGH